jgi:NitT/TauT family transport system substrate-binding protein
MRKDRSMKRYSHRAALFLLMPSLLATGCKRDNSASTQSASRAPVRLLLNWFPEAEHGGYFAAQAHDMYKQAGLEVQILPGGPGASVMARVATGDVTFGVENADLVVLARAEGAPVVAVLAPIQTSPRCIMVHAGSGIAHLRDLHDMTLAMNAGGAFSHYLRHMVPLRNVRIVPYAGNVGPFLTDPNLAQQAYSFSEPYEAHKAGAKIRLLPLTEIGFDPYTSCLITSEKMIRQQPDLVRAVVRASAAGWRRYVQDPAQTNARIAELNPQMDLAALAFGHDALQPLVNQADARQHDLGAMTRKRWETLCTQLVDVGLVPAGKVEPAGCFTDAFLPKRSASTADSPSAKP